MKLGENNLRFIILNLLYIFFTISFVNSQENFDYNNTKAKELYEELRCLVCQNQSLLDSDAPLAIDLKNLVLEKLEEGASNDETDSTLTKAEEEKLKKILDRDLLE